MSDLARQPSSPWTFFPYIFTFFVDSSVLHPTSIQNSRSVSLVSDQNTLHFGPRRPHEKFRIALLFSQVSSNLHKNPAKKTRRHQIFGQAATDTIPGSGAQESAAGAIGSDAAERTDMRPRLGQPTAVARPTLGQPLDVADGNKSAAGRAAL